MSYEDLVHEVKRRQEDSGEVRSAWDKFCDAENGGMRDPMGTSEVLLRRFLTDVVGAEVSDDTGAGSLETREFASRPPKGISAVNLLPMGRGRRKHPPGPTVGGPPAGLRHSYDPNLVDEVEYTHESEPDGWEIWCNFCDMDGCGILDPRRHPPDFLLHYLDKVLPWHKERRQKMSQQRIEVSQHGRDDHESSHGHAAANNFGTHFSSQIYDETHSFQESELTPTPLPQMNSGCEGLMPLGLTMTPAPTVIFKPESTATTVEGRVAAEKAKVESAFKAWKGNRLTTMMPQTTPAPQSKPRSSQLHKVESTYKAMESAKLQKAESAHKKLSAEAKSTTPEPLILAVKEVNMKVRAADRAKEAKEVRRAVKEVNMKAKAKSTTAQPGLLSPLEESERAPSKSVQAAATHLTEDLGEESTDAVLAELQAQESAYDDMIDMIGRSEPRLAPAQSPPLVFKPTRLEERRSKKAEASLREMGVQDRSQTPMPFVMSTLPPTIGKQEPTDTNLQKVEAAYKGIQGKTTPKPGPMPSKLQMQQAQAALKKLSTEVKSAAMIRSKVATPESACQDFQFSEDDGLETRPARPMPTIVRQSELSPIKSQDSAYEDVNVEGDTTPVSHLVPTAVHQKTSMLAESPVGRPDETDSKTQLIQERFSELDLACSNATSMPLDNNKTESECEVATSKSKSKKKKEKEERKKKKQLARLHAQAVAMLEDSAPCTRDLEVLNKLPADSELPNFESEVEEDEEDDQDPNTCEDACGRDRAGYPIVAEEHCLEMGTTDLNQSCCSWTPWPDHSPHGDCQPAHGGLLNEICYCNRSWRAFLFKCQAVPSAEPDPPRNNKFYLFPPPASGYPRDIQQEFQEFVYDVKDDGTIIYTDAEGKILAEGHIGYGQQSKKYPWDSQRTLDEELEQQDNSSLDNSSLQLRPELQIMEDWKSKLRSIYKEHTATKFYGICGENLIAALFGLTFSFFLVLKGLEKSCCHRKSIKVLQRPLMQT
eukprot:gnl/MRDRNA2_/MRDRNA2_30368_c0_seq1.p1 gnl/MRDRNA2_/MRDRNA2_30368_c0~~gnl/MRDRNA2_/MRDRNA2_30368_c0_seq1.p1  ORF type:complete len:1158 (+),score=232.05 gnl/MRDRNA2_/MRDRNA2_30368_c0_seq1:498-3476(+)